jgi:hypothetical protein
MILSLEHNAFIGAKVSYGYTAIAGRLEREDN